MKALVLKEFKSVFCSSSGAFFAIAFFLISGILLWLFSGKYNIIDGGYANLSYFFSLAPILLLVLIPSLTMRLFSEEKRNKTIEILLSRPIHPISIYFSKFWATMAFVFSVLCCTGIYIYSLYELANPIGNIDFNNIIASYFSLLCISSIFISIGLFSSAITKNQIVSFIVSFFICLFTFYGFDLLANLFIQGKIKILLASLGLNYHYELMQRGVISVNDLFCLAIWFIVPVLLYLFTLKAKAYARITYTRIIFLPILILLLLFIPNYQFDFSSDKRYTLSQYTIDLIDSNKENPLTIDIYLAGNLNYGFQHLQNETNNLLTRMNRETNGILNINYVNTYQEGEANDISKKMAQKGMPGIMLNETDREGKISRKIIYPYASISNNKDTLVISLLKNIPNNTADENINASIEGLEYEFADAIRLLNQQKPKSIAFIEGHNELTRTSLLDAEELLSKYYFINRGTIGNDINILNDFDAVIIAGPLNQYNAPEKYILDQYIMQGGKVMWLVDGTFYSHYQLLNFGNTATMKNEVNLDDMLFSYGVRINSDLIQDTQCISTYLIEEGSKSSILVPSYFQPLLIPSENLSITKNIRDVKAGFASSIDIVNNSPDVKKNVLLTSSGKAHLLKVPEPIDFSVSQIQEQPDYFNQAYISVAVSLEGNFSSAFQNRMIPDSINIGTHKTINQSSNTKMIVISSSDIITNELIDKENDMHIEPMGYDKVLKQLYGNRDFVVNAVNWLTDDEGLMSLKTKQQKIYLFNKSVAYENRDKYAILNISVPILIMALIMGTIYFYRRKKYSRSII